MTDEGLTLILRDQVLRAEHQRIAWPWELLEAVLVTLTAGLLCAVFLYGWLWTKGWLIP